MPALRELPGRLSYLVQQPLGRSGEPGSRPTGLSFLSADTRTPYLVDYPVENGSKTAHHTPRWVATAGKKHPWSATVGA